MSAGRSGRVIREAALDAIASGTEKITRAALDDVDLDSFDPAAQ